MNTHEKPCQECGSSAARYSLTVGHGPLGAGYDLTLHDVRVIGLELCTRCDYEHARFDHEQVIALMNASK